MHISYYMLYMHILCMHICMCVLLMCMGVSLMSKCIYMHVNSMCSMVYNSVLYMCAKLGGYMYIWYIYACALCGCVWICPHVWVCCAAYMCLWLNYVSFWVYDYVYVKYVWVCPFVPCLSWLACHWSVVSLLSLNVNSFGYCP